MLLIKCCPRCHIDKKKRQIGVFTSKDRTKKNRTKDRRQRIGQRKLDKGQRTGQRTKGCEKCVYIAPYCPQKTSNFFSPAALSEKCVYIAPFCTPKKLKYFVLPAASCLKNVYIYMAIWHPKNNHYFFWSVVRFLTEFFHLAKKSYFSRMSNCLSNFDWSFVLLSFVLLSNPLSSAAFLETKVQKC